MRVSTRYCPKCTRLTRQTLDTGADVWRCPCEPEPVPEPEDDLPEDYKPWPPAEDLRLCNTCGALVGDTVMHNDFHYKVDNTAERANNSVQHDDGI
jgi:hypothetical protein